MSSVGHALRRGPASAGRPEPFEDWLSVVVMQLIGCRHLLYTRAGRLFGFAVGWHVYTADGCYVGSFRATTHSDDPTELYSAGGEYLGERDPDVADRLAVDLSKRALRLPRTPELPSLAVAEPGLYPLPDPLPRRDGWEDFPSPERFASPLAGMR